MKEQVRGLGPFTERNGVNAHAEVQAMLAEPEVLFSDAEKTEAFAFARGLFNGNVTLSDGSVLAAYDDPEKAKTLKQISDSKVEAQAKTFYLGAFATKEGKQALAKLGLAVDEPEKLLPQLADVETVTRKASAKRRREAADATHTWYVEDLAERLGQDAENDVDYTGDISVTINYDPDKVLNKIEGLQTYRRFYRTVHTAINEEAGSPLKEAKRMLLNLHMAKVNSQLAIMYPHAMNLGRQLLWAPATANNEAWGRRLRTALPLLRKVFAHEHEYDVLATPVIPNFSRRLDLLRNGAADRGGPDFSPISEEVERLAETYELEEPSPDEAVFTEDVVEKLRKAMVASGQLIDFLEAGLDSWGLLSSARATKDELDKRSGPAADGKWQVVAIPDSGKLDVTQSKKAMNVGENQKRTMANGLAVGAHETTHDWQQEYADELAEQLALAEISGRRALTTAEMGAIIVERQAYGMLGMPRPTNFTYVRALQAKLAGANRLQAARASYESAIAGKDLTEAELRSQQRSAADRVERLYRHNGHNSQPLDYSEQELMVQAAAHLSREQLRAFAIAGGVFSLADYARLRRYGLWELPTHIKIDIAADMMEVFRARFMEDWLHAE